MLPWLRQVKVDDYKYSGSASDEEDQEDEGFLEDSDSEDSDSEDSDD